MVRFADKERHQLFLEPMGRDTKEMYLQGFSSSMPEDVDMEPVSDVTPTQYPQMPEDEDCDSFGSHSHVNDE